MHSGADLGYHFGTTFGTGFGAKSDIKTCRKMILGARSAPGRNRGSKKESREVPKTEPETKLKRMPKEKLGALLGELLEEAVKTQMAEAVGAKSGNESVIALATLRMLHDMLANSVEQGLNVFFTKVRVRVTGVLPVPEGEAHIRLRR